jgi:4a-hydroxytetrahydrobiopterin dehydratase
MIAAAGGAPELQRKHCVPCEEGTALSATAIRGHLASVPQWTLVAGDKRIRREWNSQDFAAALDFFRRVGELAENEGHHPDLHLTGYRHIAIELSTHAVNGLTENDFILAAKIDALPLALKE